MVREIKETEEQLNIIKSKADVKRIIACAGSGKTMVLVNSIIEIIKDGDCSPDKILALTFTRNAAENMRMRIKESIGEELELEGIDIFTFNSFGNEIISEHSFEFGLGKDFKIISNSQSWQILYKIFNESDLKYLRAGKKVGDYVQSLLVYIESLKNNLISVGEFKDYLNGYEDILSGYKSVALKNEEKKLIKSQGELFNIYREYEKRKVESNCIDYLDQVFMPYFLLNSRKSIKAKYQQRYKYIFVDEFQDTNIAQSYLLSMLYKPGSNKLIVVGDDDQGIYSFRGASVENILNFHEFKELKGSIVSDFFLTTNFRSGSNIISIINSVISSNSRRFKKELKPEDNRKKSEVVFYYNKTRDDEAAEIAKIIKYLVNRGIKLKQIAILARRKKFKKIIGALEDSDIKFELVGGKDFFFEPEVLFIISWLRVVENINDEISIVYLLKSGKYKICDRDIFYIKRNYKNIEEKISIVDGIINYKKNTRISMETKKRLSNFIASLKLYISKSGELELKELISLIIEDSEILNELKSTFGSSVRRKIKNIENIIRIAAEFQKSYVESSLSAFITYLKDVAKTDYDDPEMTEFSGENSVKIMSIHAAKGLEFEVVFMPALWKSDYAGRTLNKGFVIPAELRKDNSIYKEKKNFSSLKSFSGELKNIKIEEERRVFYVGCSRAKKILLLSSSEYEDNNSLNSDDARQREIVQFFDDIANNSNLKVVNREGLNFIKSHYGSQLHKDYKSYKNVLRFIGTGKKSKRKINIISESRWVALQKNIMEDIIRAEVDLNGNKSIQEILNKVNSGLNYNSSQESNLDYKSYFPLTWIIDYKKCPLLYRLKHIYLIPEKVNKELARGEEIHSYLKNITLAGFKNSILKEEVLSRFSDKEIRKYLKNFLDSCLWDFSGIKSIMLEQLFYWRIKSHYIVGRFDRVDFKKDNKIRIIDYKLSVYSGGKKNIKKGGHGSMAEFQMKAYMAALSKIYRKPVDNITGLIFYLKDGVKKSVSLKNEEIKQLEREILGEIKSIQNQDFRTNYKKSCKNFCSYFDFCSSMFNKI
jgi:DNA helicase II / ATP-dependent DNA helicase PcrA